MTLKQKMTTFTVPLYSMKLSLLTLCFCVFNLLTPFTYAAPLPGDEVKSMATVKMHKEHFSVQPDKPTVSDVEGGAILKQLNDTLHHDVNLYVPLLRLNTETPSVVGAATQALTLRNLVAIQQQLKQLSSRLMVLETALEKAGVMHVRGIGHNRSDKTS